MRLLTMVESEDVDLILRKKGNHRLMKPRDLTLLTYTLDNLIKEYEYEWKAKSKL